MKWLKAVYRLCDALRYEDEDGLYQALEILELLQDEPLTSEEMQVFDELANILEETVWGGKE